MGWFLSGTLIGPAIGPFVGGIIVTYTSWRVIFWVQSGLSGLAALGTFFILPETIQHKKYTDLEGLSGSRKAAVLWNMANPWRVLKLMVTYPNLCVYPTYLFPRAVSPEPRTDGSHTLGRWSAGPLVMLSSRHQPR